MIKYAIEIEAKNDRTSIPKLMITLTTRAEENLRHLRYNDQI